MLLVIFGLASLQGHTQSISTPFMAEVAVESQDPRARRKAAEQGLLDVLVRVSGSENVRANGTILAQAPNAIRYVEQFEYTELLDQEALDAGNEFALRLRFSERIVKRLLRDGGENFWSLNRPSVLVWLVEDSAENGKNLVGFDTDSEIVQGLLKGARYRGVKLQFPLLDFEDQVAMGVQNLWDFDESAIREASERYQAELILVGTYTTTSSGQIWSNWQYFFEENSRLYDFRGEQALGIGVDAIAVLADFLASKFAVPLSEQDSGFYYAEVSNIRNYRDYRALMDALEGLDAIGAVMLDATSADVVSLRLKSEGSVEQLTGLLALNRRLKTHSDADGNVPAWQQARLGSLENPLRYFWQP